MSLSKRCVWTFTVIIFLFTCGQLRPLTRADRLNQNEKLEYLILRTVDRGAAEEYLRLSDPANRADYLNWFWQKRDTGEYRILKNRAERAKELFGKLDLLGDERIPVYIKYGPPRREEYAPRPLENETLRLFVNPAEIWSYDSIGLQFDFVKKGVGYQQVGFTRFGKGYFPPAFEPVDYGAQAPAPLASARKIDLKIGVYRFAQIEDGVEVELHYGLPGVELVKLKQHLIHFQFLFISRSGIRVSRAGWFGFHPDTTTDYVVGRDVFHLPFDLYTVTVEAVNPDGTIYGIAEQKLSLIEYLRRVQPVSDIAFYALIDDVFQSPQFVRPEWQRVIPLPGAEVKAGGTFYVLFEAYNLKTDSFNRHRAEVIYEIMEVNSGQMAVIPTPVRFITGNGTTGVAQERVHTMDLRPGTYLLIARIRDLNSDRTASATARFSILPSSQPKRF